jgi:hypothetical protein
VAARGESPLPLVLVSDAEPCGRCRAPIRRLQLTTSGMIFVVEPTETHVVSSRTGQVLRGYSYHDPVACARADARCRQ